MATIVLALLFVDPVEAVACGCLSPPEPVGDEDYAVNQQAEQIIFEVGAETVTAHVLIRYAGDPASFAWIVPVPGVPELALSSTAAFGLLDQRTSPVIDLRTENVCPEQEWVCRYHSQPYCGDDDDDDLIAFPDAGANSASDAGPSPGDPPVEIVDRQVIGAYDTIVFSAGDAAAAAQWLQDEGFIVNDTMAPYMQPYADAGMLFVAAKLVPGADVSEIRPLRITYPGTSPMIPLRLTAVAAEPHMTITSYVYGSQYYVPGGRPIASVPSSGLSRDRNGRTNYPMLLARSIDEAGGDAFVIEYSAVPPRLDFGPCCEDIGFDMCGVASTGECECPGSEVDAVDCAEREDLVDGVQLVNELFDNHALLTRLTTRMSAEEMTFDPMFDPGSFPGIGRLTLSNSVESLAACAADIIETEAYEEILARQDCSTVYCGPGECVATVFGPGCACDAGTVARRFTDLDGAPSVTCVPGTPPVDLRAGGLVLPDGCSGISCGMGQCVELNGVPTCDCDGSAAAALGPSDRAPVCRAIVDHTATPGAQDYSDGLSDLRVCAPAPPSCGEGGWLEQRAVTIRGEACEGRTPDLADRIAPPAPTCPSTSRLAGCGCRVGGNRAGGAAPLVLLLALLGLKLRRARE